MSDWRLPDGRSVYRTWVRYGRDPLDVAARSCDGALAEARALRPGTCVVQPLLPCEALGWLADHWDEATAGAVGDPGLSAEVSGPTGLDPRLHVWVMRDGRKVAGRFCRSAEEAEAVMDAARVPAPARRWEDGPFRR